ncbi:MAG: Calcium-transporting ATPase 1 [Firmicutes bacterium ADurb.Bin300]|nr:MAG: Calcium-transporting ATPase 1 [Firmicutes bacterium ADurb.Bin300]
MKYYLEEISAVFEDIKSGETGLSSDQAAERLLKNGRNKLDEGKKKSLTKRFLEQLSDPMIIILIVAAVISAVTEFYEARSAGKPFFPTDTLIISIVVLINSVLGVFQESKAEKAIEALQEMSASTSKVIRDGDIVSVKSEELVVGDVILLEAGDAVPADCRIFECASMKIEEAALTGESVPVDKLIKTLTGSEKNEITLGDRKNMAYMGSTVVYGRGKAVITATGMQTEMGKIADAIANAQEGATPLQIKLSQLSKILTYIVLGICVFIFAFSIFMDWGTISASSGAQIFNHMLGIFMIAVSLAVAAIPEGLVAVVTIVLSIGVTNMSKKNAIIRRLTAVETLGCAQIICSDKTGTLTQNRMTVTDKYTYDEKLLAEAMALCTDAEISSDGSVTGEPTEAALVVYANSLSLNKNDLKLKAPRIGEAPFDSVRKMMSTVHSYGENGEIIQYTKGAPDEVLKKCTFAIAGGEIVALSDEIKEKILEENKRMADKALRVLACACRKYDSVPDAYEADSLEKDLIFLGLTGMIDPVRPEVKEAIVECRSAGITPIMITGDHKDTAVAIGLELGIIDSPDNAITGAQLSELSDEQFEERVEHIFVYARVQPEHKTRIVTAWRKKGYITAMTGDGVNDAPSIKSADIGIGMGITGTDVTKNVSDMVLADDNFASIVSAVSEGRRIYDNIRKAIQFLLGSNLSEVLAIFFATLLGFTILKPVHLLFINLVTDSFPALALGLEKAERDIMKRKPRNPKDGIFAGGIGIDIFYQGSLVTVLTLLAYFIGEFIQNGHWQFRNISLEGGAEGMTMAFLTMSMCEIFHSFNMRSQRGSVISMEVRGSHNITLYGAMLASLILTTLIIEVPALRDAFQFAPITHLEYALSLALAISVIPIVETVKVFQRLKGRSSR